MSLKRKIYVENQKKVVEGKIAVRRAFLKEKGLDSAVIQRDVTIRKMKARSGRQITGWEALPTKRS